MPRVVAISVFPVTESREVLQPFVKSSTKPVIQLELLGDTQTFEDLGHGLFQYFLYEQLGEALHHHVWRFEPYSDRGEDDEYGPAMDASIPLLSKEMNVKIRQDITESLLAEKKSEPLLVKEGSEFLFFYDEGYPTRLIVTIDRINPETPLLPGRVVKDYPRKIETETDAVRAAKRQRISEAPVLTITMDEAYPHLRKRLIQERGVLFLFGRGCEPPITADTAYCVIWGGGGCRAAYKRTVECYREFLNADEFFLSFDRAIQKQVSPGFSSLQQRKLLEDTNTGRRYYAPLSPVGGAEDPLQVIAEVYPTYVPIEDYRQEMIEDMQGFCTFSAQEERSSGIKTVQSWSTWCFNYA